MKPHCLLVIPALASFGMSVLIMQPALAQRTSEGRIAEIVQSGKLRVGIGLGTPTLAVKNSTTGEVRGPSMDLGRALATRMGVAFESVEYIRPGAVIDGAGTKAWDVSFLVFDPKRAEQADFSQPYMETDFTYLVPAQSRIRQAADVDKTGIRIAVEKGGASDLELTRVLKSAELVRTESVAAALELVRSGTVQAQAAPRPVVLAELHELPGSRVLDDGFAVIFLAALVPKGHPGRLDYVNEFIAEAKASGLITKIIEANRIPGIRMSSGTNSLK